MNYLNLAATRDFQADKSCSSASLTAVDDVARDDDGTAATSSDVNLDDPGCTESAEGRAAAAVAAINGGGGEVF